MRKKSKNETVELEVLPPENSNLPDGFAVRLENAYLDAVSGMRKVLTFGMLCIQAKQNVAHGQFRKWVEGKCPRISYKTALQFRHLTELILEACGVKLLQLQKFEIEPEKLFTTPRRSLPAKLGKFRDTLEQVIEHKSQYQLELEFGIRKPRKGELAGKGATNNPDGNNGWDKRKDPFQCAEAAYGLIFGTQTMDVIEDKSFLGTARMLRNDRYWKHLPMDARYKMVEELRRLTGEIEKSYAKGLNDSRAAIKKATKKTSTRKK